MKIKKLYVYFISMRNFKKNLGFKNYNDALYFIFFIIISIYLITGYSNLRYDNNYPTLYLYPNNTEEVKLVKKFNNERLKNNKINNFVKLTDRSCAYAFINEFDDITIEELNSIDNNIDPIIHFFKKLFNRARPFQVDKNYKKYDSTTAFSGSFPSGHSAQAQYIAKRLSEKYPEKKERLYKIAEQCGIARVYGGLHYPSDHEFSKLIVSLIP